MDADPKLQRLVRNYAFLSGLARAAGREPIAHEYADRMMRAWALLNPAEGEAIADVDDDGVYGASGGW